MLYNVKFLLFLCWLLFFSGCSDDSSSDLKLNVSSITKSDNQSNVCSLKLYSAAESGDIITVRNLLEQGTSADTPIKNGKTALHIAAEKNQPEICKLLLEAGASPRVGKQVGQNMYVGYDQNGMTPADYAVKHVQTLQVFLEHGVSIQSKGFMGCTLLHLAVQFNALDSIQYLIDKGLDVNAEVIFNGGMTKECIRPIDMVVSPEAVDLLIKAGAKVKVETGIRSPLHYAVKNNKYNVIDSLIAAGADVNARDKFQNTPLHYAALSGQSQPVLILIKAGAEIDAKNKDGLTPLFLAANGLQIEAFKTLIEAGADITAKDNKGRNIYQYIQGQNKLLEILENVTSSLHVSPK